MLICTALIQRHKYKSAFLGVLAGYSAYKGTQMYYQFKNGFAEFQRITEALDKQRQDLPEGEAPEEGTSEELNFMTQMLKNVSITWMEVQH